MREKITSPAVGREAGPEVGYHTRTLIRALAILDTFSSERRPLAVKDLHLLLDLPKPTVSRLAAVLERSGYLRRRGQTYLLGPKLFELGSLFAREDGLVEISRRPLELLAADARQTSSLAVLMTPDILHVVVVPSASPVHHVTEAGSRAPAHSTGLGKALLADLPDQALDGVLSQMSMQRYTPTTITERQRLREEVTEIRGRGYAIDNEETALGLKCVAVAVRLPRLGSAAISLSGPAADFTNRTIPAFAGKLEITAARLRDSFNNAADYTLPVDTAALAGTTSDTRSRPDLAAV